jgi:formylglycine-generating enzyme required for sulfatase activity
MMRKVLFIVLLLVTKVAGNVCVAESKTFIVNGVLFEMVFVEGGTFTRGCDSNSRGCINDEIPIHQVTLPDFYIGKFEVTQLLWRTVMGHNPSRLRGDHLPVESVSWNDCREFIRRLNEMTGVQFSLPTEAQWEFAARGGNKSRGYRYSGSDNIDEVAWYKENSGGRVRRVGDKAPNELGIHDMTGNVFEWCSDWYNANYFRFSAEESPIGPVLGSYRVFRGGSWRNSASFTLPTRRNYNRPDKRFNDLGLRLILNP